MSWELGRDAHESKGASPASAPPLLWVYGQLWPWLDREEPWDGAQVLDSICHPSQQQKQGVPEIPWWSPRDWARGRLLTGGLLLRPQKQAVVLWAQNC